MSLVTPLKKPLRRSLVQPLKALGKSFYELLPNVGEVWPLKSNLIGSEGTAITFTRASADIYPNAKGDYIENSTNEASYGVGLVINGLITNICTNYNIEVDAALTNITDGANVTSTRVVAAQIPIGAVYVVESTATDATGNSVQIAGGAANTNDHSAKVIAKITAGTGAWLHIGSTPSNGVRITNTGEFAVTELNGYTPTAADTLYITPDNGTTIQWFANCFYELSFVTPHFVKTSGATASLATADVQVSTTGWALNDGTYYFELPRGLTDIGSNQFILNASQDADNYFRIVFVTGADVIRIAIRIASVTYNLDLSYTADGTPINFCFSLSSTAGKMVAASNGSTDSNVNTSDMVIGSSAQLGAFNASTNNMYGELKYFSRFDTVTTDLTDLYWAARNG